MDPVGSGSDHHRCLVLWQAEAAPLGRGGGWRVVSTGGGGGGSVAGLVDLQPWHAALKLLPRIDQMIRKTILHHVLSHTLP